MADPALLQLGAAELAARIARGDLSSAEVIEAHIARIDEVNERLNAVVVKRYEQARAEAKEADRMRAAGAPLGALHGVPVTIKESLDVTGTPSTFGLPLRASTLADRDERHVARLRRAGAIVLGKTNVAQSLLFIETDNPLYGRTNNPWNVDRTPGGSSGGEGAIIAAGGSPLGLGSDLGGSTRVPAALCGIAGLKSTAGRLPDDGRHSIPLGQREIVSQIGILARGTRDVALALEVINGGRDPDPPGYPLRDLGRGVAGLRVAMFADDGIVPPARAVRRAVDEAAARLRAAGAEVVDWTPPELETAHALFFSILAADGGRGIKRLLGKNRLDPRIAELMMGGSAPRAVLPLIRALLRRQRRPHIGKIAEAYGHRSTDEYWQLVERKLDYERRFAAALDGASDGPIDLILSPAVPLPAFRHGAARELATAGVYAPLYNVLGYPAGVVPMTTVQPHEEEPRAATGDRMVEAARHAESGSAGLPIGVQIAGRPWREGTVLAAMQAIER